MTQNLRALEVMGVPHNNQRRAPRRPVNVGGTVSSGAHNHVVWVKDISEEGACLFTKFQPAVGETFLLTLTGSRLPSNLRRDYEVRVIRVQCGRPGAAVGVAVVFTLIGTAIQVA